MFKQIIPVFLLVNIGLFQLLVGPISMDFKLWLNKNGYSDDDFESKDFENIGSFGGKEYFSYTVKKIPVIFIHGNSDGALNNGTPYGSGWNSHLKIFLDNGYTKAELYGITWGDRNVNNALKKTFSCNFVKKIRRFILAVLEYTKCKYVNIVSHSIGVTLTRKAIKGGIINENNDVCDIGEYLGNKVNTFIAISGANYGLCFCINPFFYETPSCNKKNGFWPGDGQYSNECINANNYTYQSIEYSKLLQELNDDKKPEGKFVVTIFSTGDELIGNRNKVFGRYTSSLPSASTQYISHLWNHTETKDKSQFYVFREIMKNDFKINLINGRF
ncbi:Lipase EstA/Esterase EstB family-containing protein [Strongyloides ratti]|uniref:Lipase EstA/Esterase EstB family-containing protein n=1 Tax=Strongyloides ratti TaxID=34506 RepID=A0A090MTZ5_STRRB|nr:Lipase EstA/Esterase EstB family-containing protein [Strongyloides ratti]CEF61878.1 Lipase EstA/Esterase EstB family-containing protein [Strongyloides ratti]